MRVEQFEKYTGPPLGDPSPGGDFLQVKTVPHGTTSNEGCWELWRRMNEEAQKLSLSAAAMQPIVTQDLLSACVSAINRTFVTVHYRTRTRANKLFSSTYGGPTEFAFVPSAVRWPGESPAALVMVLKWVEAIYQIPQVPSNRLDMGVLHDHAMIIARPLFDLKADLMRQYFGIEVKGEISVDELDAVFRDSKIQPPLIASLDDRRDMVADKEREDAVARTDETVKRPSRELTESISSGAEVWQWTPKSGDWLVVGEQLKRMEAAGPMSTPDQPFPFSTSVVGGSS